jgi:hypothetical protein
MRMTDLRLLSFTDELRRLAPETDDEDVAEE